MESPKHETEMANVTLEDDSNGGAGPTIDLRVAVGNGEAVELACKGQSKGCIRSRGNAGASEQCKCHHVST